MFTETLKDYEDVVGIACEGKLTKDDMESMHALLHERLASADKPGMVVDLTGFQGYEGLSALREDMQMDTAHRNDFSRIAVVGDSKWMEWGTSLANAVTRAEMRWFDAGEAEAAKEWARQR
ncbi:STAS/SEC14 domain-containing protein [Jannaschia formosa]|uniref:STAS/SEC14 domain-containing protein n=1 Tax=Jannaschia formosa TaxID=2259592 RepID=UPI000E1C27D9|nr:STAS/SEC14 domain-containing protein [Jannaschia formosa]TFL19459.1 STAS/SEC14 domain-containing protein [Jannaschia formosa]